MNASVTARDCSLCGSAAGWVARQRVLGKYDVDYFACPTCELLQTEAPHWLAEAYAEAISQLDTGAVRRNQDCSRITAIVAALADVGPDAKCLDFGGGHGVFVRMMRDLGLDFRWFDAYAENLYARGFEGAIEEPYALVTAFEVVEHLADVRGDLERLFGPRPERVLIGTLLHDGHQPGWWYYLLESGQHVCFYARRTLAWIADHFGYDLIAGSEYALFVRRDVPLRGIRRRLAEQSVRRPHAAINLLALLPAPLLRRLSPYRSRVERDHEAMKTSVS
jgi:hypothetical protein